MNTQQHIARGGRIIRQKKGRRVITIAYKEDNGVLKYGATIFFKKNSKEQWTRDGQRQIAIDRLESMPVEVDTPDFEHIGELDRFVRKCLVDHGCHSGASGHLR